MSSIVTAQKREWTRNVLVIAGVLEEDVEAAEMARDNGYLTSAHDHAKRAIDGINRARQYAHLSGTPTARKHLARAEAARERAEAILAELPALTPTRFFKSPQVR